MTFVGIGGDATGSELQPFIDETGTVGFAHLDDSTGELWERFGTSGRSTFMFLDDDGSFVLTEYGIADEGRLIAEIERMLET